MEDDTGIESRIGWQAAIAIEYVYPLDDATADSFDGQNTLALEGGFKPTPRMLLGLVGTFGAARDHGAMVECDPNTNCSVRNAVGFQIRGYLNPEGHVIPWASAGLGLQWAKVSQGGGAADDEVAGWHIRGNIGVEFRPFRWIGFGFIYGLIRDSYGDSHSLWGELGMRVVFMP